MKSDKKMYAPCDGLEGPAAKFAHAHGLFRFQGEGAPLSYTSNNGGVLLKMTFEQQQEFHRSLAATFQHWPYAWNEVIDKENPNGVGIDLDIGMVNDDEHTLRELQALTRIFWNLCKVMLCPEPDSSVEVLCCLSWPPYEYDCSSGSAKARPAHVTMFGKPCIASDQLLHPDVLAQARDHADEEKTLTEPPTVRAWQQMATTNGFRSTWSRPPATPANEDTKKKKDMKVGLHLYAVRKLDLANEKVDKLFVSRSDLAVLNAVVHQQVETYFGPHARGNEWKTVIDAELKSLRIPGGGNVKPCPHCNTKKRKAMQCLYCDNTSKLDLGRPYLPSFWVGSDGVMDASRVPVELVSKFTVLLELARISHYPEHDPPPVALNVPAEWLADPKNSAYYTVSCGQGQTRKACLPKRAVASKQAKGQRQEMDSKLHSEAFEAFESWMRQTPHWGQLTVSQIYLTCTDPSNWSAVVVPRGSKQVCARKQASHKSGTIWFRVSYTQLVNRRTIQQYCHAAGCQTSQNNGTAWAADEKILVAFSSALERINVKEPKLKPAAKRAKHSPEPPGTFEECFSQKEKTGEGMKLDEAGAKVDVRPGDRKPGEMKPGDVKSGEKLGEMKPGDFKRPKQKKRTGHMLSLFTRKKDGI